MQFHFQVYFGPLPHCLHVLMVSATETNTNKPTIAIFSAEVAYEMLSYNRGEILCPEIPDLVEDWLRRTHSPCHCEAREASRSNLGGGNEIAASRLHRDS